MICRVCNFLNIKKKFSLKYIHENIKYFECNNCKFIFQNPIPGKNELSKIYSNEYFKINYKKKNKEFLLRKKQYIHDKKIILKYFTDNTTKEILDYGCGNGSFLSLFKSKKFGYEFNINAKLNSKVKRLGLNDVFKKKYDLIIMRGVIEHLPDFDVKIKKLAQCVKTNGLIYITATPNTNNLTFFLSNKDFNQNHPGHIYHFNNVNLNLLFLKNNFLNLETIFQYSDTPYANFKKDYNYLKLQLKNYKKQIKKKSPPSSGNMITAIYKKCS